MKKLLEAYSEFLQTYANLDADLDTSWFEDINNRRDLHSTKPDSFVYYDSETKNPLFPTTDKTGRTSQKVTAFSLKMARAAAIQNPENEKLNSIVQKLEELIK